MTITRIVSSFNENSASYVSVLEKLRRLLFRPKLLAFPIIAAAFCAGSVTAAEITFDPTKDITIGDYDTLVLYNNENDLKRPDNDITKTITLAGGTLSVNLGEDNDLLLGKRAKVESSKDFVYGEYGGVIDVNSEGATLMIGRTHQALDDIIKTGNGDLVLSTSSAGDEHIFGNFFVSSGHVHIWGYDTRDVKTTFYGDVVLTVNDISDPTSAGNLTLYGDTVFEQNVSVNGTGKMDNMLILSAGENEFKGMVILNNYGGIGDQEGVTNTFKDSFMTKGNSYFRGNNTFEGPVFLTNSLFASQKNSELNFYDVIDSNYSNLKLEGKSHINEMNLSLGSFLFVTESGELMYDGDLNINTSVAYFKEGNVTFNNNISVSGTLYLDPTTGEIFSQKGILYLLSNTQFNNRGIIDVNYGGTLYVGSDVDYNGTTIEITDITNDGGVIGYANRLNTDILFKSKDANVLYSDLLSKYNEDTQKIEYCNNDIFFTYDELHRPTYLEWDATSKGIKETIAKNQIVNHALISGNEGYGNIDIHAYNTKTREEYTPGDISSTNGYTVVFEDANKEELFKYYSGSCYIINGTTVLKGATEFGSETSTKSIFYVMGQSYTKDDALSEKWKQNIYRTNTSGVLAFYRGEETPADKAPVLNSSSVTLFNGQHADEESEDILKGARLWIDTSCNDSSSVRQLGTINANQSVMIGDQTKVWYDKISTIDSQTDMIFTINSPNIYKVSKTVELLTPQETKEYVESIFGGAQLVKANYNQATGAITINARNVADYASDKNMSDKEKEFAEKFDNNRMQKGADADLAFNDALYNEKSEEKVKQTIHNLSLLGVVTPQINSHYGNPTSAFFSGGGFTASTGSSRRGQDEYDPNIKPEEKKEQSALNKTSDNSPKRTVWADFTRTAVNADTYDIGEVTFNGYSMHRNGVIGGIKRDVDDTTSCGLFFGFSTPEVKQWGDYEGNIGSYSTEMDMDDFQFAFHLDKRFAQNWEAAFYVAGGTQSMEWDRMVTDAETGFYDYESKSTGNTFTATAYLARRIDMTKQWTLRPTAGVDSEHSWLFGFDETQTQGAAKNSNVWMNMFTQEYSYDTIKYSRNTARVGLSSVLEGEGGRGGLTGRVFYGVQLGGSESPFVTLASDQYKWEDLETHAMGGESISLGMGAYLHLNQAKTITLTGDYNAILYKNAQTQNATGGFQWKF